jgi:hypothetical protein
VPGPSPVRVVEALTGFVRELLRPHAETGPGSVTIVTAAAPFATTSYGRVRLLRQAHASGQLSADPSHAISDRIC